MIFCSKCCHNFCKEQYYFVSWKVFNNLLKIWSAAYKIKLWLLDLSKLDKSYVKMSIFII